MSPEADVRELRAEIAGRKDVAQEERVLIRDGIWNFHKPPVGEGHPHILRLAAVDAAAELPAALFAVVDVAAPAEEAVAAEGLAGGGHPVAGPEVPDPLPHLGDLADKLVPEDDPRLRARDEAVADVQVARADGRAGYPHDRVARVPEFRNGALLQADLVVSAVDKRQHGLFHT